MDSPSPTYHPPLKKNQSPKKGGGDSLLVKDWLGCQENIGFFFFFVLFWSFLKDWQVLREGVISLWNGFLVAESNVLGFGDGDREP